VVFLLARWTWATWQGRDVAMVPTPSRPVRYGLGALVVVFWVARNLPGSWLAP